tara:strand:+ start:434 stop:682 length:249 start_codon:yes stop_codon:yes gene_type:complete
MRYAVLIDLDGDIMYVPENTNVFRNFPDPKIFDSLEDASKERDKWNTGVVVEYKEKDINISIREMTDEERLRAMHRSRMNNG